MEKRKLFIVLGLMLSFFAVSALAGTGGSEVSSWYTDLSGNVKGFWGKIIAFAFMAVAIMAFKGGMIVVGIFMGFLGMSIGTIPDMIDSKYTAIASTTIEVMSMLPY